MSLFDMNEPTAGLPPLLARVIELAVYAEKHDDSTDRTGEAAFLGGVARLAVQNVGFRGVLAPPPELYKPIEDLAKEHLEWVDAKKELREALDRVKKFKRRDAIETAHIRVLSVSDTAYYYTGLAFGLTVADLSRRR
jgi:ATP phosphoribosyltransferase regulatory subunit HisZ